MSEPNSFEPDFEAESKSFRAHAVKKGMCLDTFPGGFYVDQRTQHAWAEWIRQVVREQRT